MEEFSIFLVEWASLPALMYFIRTGNAIKALDYRIKSYEESLDTGNIDSDEASDIANDAMYLEAIREGLAKTLTQSEEVRVREVC